MYTLACFLSLIGHVSNPSLVSACSHSGKAIQNACYYAAAHFDIPSKLSLEDN